MSSETVEDRRSGPPSLDLRWLTRVLNHCPEPAMIARCDGVVVYANDAALALGGDRAPGAPFLGLWEAGNADTGGAYQEITARIRAAEEGTVGARGRDAAGGVKPFEVTIVALEPASESDAVALVLVHEPGPAARAGGAPPAVPDPITGLACGAALLERIDHALSRAGEELRGMSLVSVDLNQYRQLAANYSVADADHVLKVLAERSRRGVSEAKVIGVFGESSVAVLMEEAMTPGAPRQPALQSLHQAVVGDVPLPASGEAIFLRPGIGVALFPDHGSTARELLVRAGVAAERAAKRHSAQWQFFSAPDDELERRQVENESIVQRSIARGEFDVRYLPRFRSSTGRLSGVEQRLIWRHPRLGPIPPAEVLDDRQLRYLYDALEDFLLARAFGQWKAWADEGFDPARIAVQLPERVMQREGLVERIRSQLRRHRMPGHALSLELGGTATLKESSSLHVNLDGLRRLGIDLTLNNLGTGASILDQVQGLSPNALKMDGALVRRLPVDSVATAIARAACTLAQGLGTRLVADGVETTEQLRFLTQHGCEEFQGPLASAPVEAAAVPLQFAAGLPSADGSPATGESQALPQVVVVDDDPRVLRAIRRELRRGPWSLTVFDSPEDALRAVAATDVAVLIADQRMPQMSGLEVVRQARELSPQTVRIIMSAHADVHTLTRALNEGALFRFIGKPWERDALREAIAQGLSAYQAAVASH